MSSTIERACFSLRLDPVLGSNLADTCKDAVRLAILLSLHHIEFEFNGVTWTVYPDGTGYSFSASGIERTYRMADDGSSHFEPFLRPNKGDETK